jgi:hypothetical protein
MPSLAKYRCADSVSLRPPQREAITESQSDHPAALDGHAVVSFLRHNTAISGKSRTTLEKALVGPAGEHFVLFRLYQQGMLASLAPPGSPTVDVLVMAPDETVVATLQVKTRTTVGGDHGWHMSRKHEEFSAPRSFYAFVDLEPNPPITYVVPSKVVAKVVRAAHQAWLAIPGKKGQAHHDNEIRRLLPTYAHEVRGFPAGWLDDYKERWDLLMAAVKA